MKLYIQSSNWHTTVQAHLFMHLILLFCFVSFRLSLNVSLSFFVAHRLHNFVRLIIIFIYQTVWLLVRPNRIVHEVLTRQYIFVWQLYWFILFSRYTWIGRYLNCLLANLISSKKKNKKKQWKIAHNISDIKRMKIEFYIICFFFFFFFFQLQCYWSKTEWTVLFFKEKKIQLLKICMMCRVFNN